jgi:LuxR family maltose regulon positive regulatory protein
MEEQVIHSNVPIVFGNQVFLERPHIVRLLEDAVEKPVVCVTAGAGYGKTQSVYSFIRNANVQTAWIQFSERDNICDHFWENFIAAVKVMSPETAKQLENMEFPDTERRFNQYLMVPQKDVIPNKKFIFVYDDTHLLKEASVLRFIERSITSPFPTITSILISRNELPLNLMKFESKGQLARITEEELRFSKEELEEYLTLQQLKPSPETVSDIYRDTEGWAFAIHLAGLSLKNTSGSGYVSSAMKSNIFKLIESEIISGMHEKFRKFLIRLSLIDHFTPELLGEISGNPELSGEMENVGSFIRFDIYSNAYRIHHLLLDYLSGLQVELTEAEKREVYAKAAKWCAENNQKTDALGYYEKSGDYDRVITVCYTMPLTLPRYSAQLLLDIFDRAPKELFTQHPLAYVIYTRLLMNLSMVDKAAERLRDIISQLETGGPYVTSTSRILAGCYNNLGFTGVLSCTYTRVYSFVRSFEKAAEYAETSKYEVKPPLSVLTLGSYVCRAGTAENGEMQKHNRAISQYVPHVSFSMGGCCYGLEELAGAELAFFKYKLPEAEELALKALAKARERDQYEIENRALYYLLRIKFAQGDVTAIKEIESQLEAQMDKEFYLNRFTYHDIVFGWLNVQLEQGENIAWWLKSDFEENELNTLIYGLEMLVKIKYLFSVKRCSAALAILGRWGEKYSSGDFVIGKIGKKVLEAVCRYQIQDKDGAYKALETAWNLARPEKLVMPFIELGKEMRTLLEAAIKDRFPGIPLEVLEDLRQDSSVYAKKLFSVIEKFRKPNYYEGKTQPDQAGTALSRRESEVLKGLSHGFTREEIARESSISVNTVKSAIRNVYNKLGALNRADAVRKATAKGILKD